jgi:hypothetical protein
LVVVQSRHPVPEWINTPHRGRADLDRTAADAIWPARARLTERRGGNIAAAAVVRRLPALVFSLVFFGLRDRHSCPMVAELM